MAYRIKTIQEFADYEHEDFEKELQKCERTQAIYNGISKREGQEYHDHCLNWELTFTGQYFACLELKRRGLIDEKRFLESELRLSKILKHEIDRLERRVLRFPEEQRDGQREDLKLAMSVYEFVTNRKE